MLVRQLPSGETVTWLPSGHVTRSSKRIRKSEERPARPAPVGTPRRLTLGTITIAAHEHHPGAHRTSGVAAGRTRLLMVRGGSVQIRSRDGSVEIGDGQGILVTGTASVRMSSARGCDVITVGMPVDALPELSLPRNSAILIEDAALLGPIGAFVHTLYTGERPDVLSRERFAQLLHDMVLIAVRPAASGAGVALAPSLYLRAAAVLQRRYTDADLTPSAVAAEVNVSLRQLEREFQPSGRTIRQEIRRLRVAAAVALLQDELHAGQTVDAIAARVGFSNGSSLARAISAEGFAPPSRLRPGARSGGRDRTRHT